MYSKYIEEVSYVMRIGNRLGVLEKGKILAVAFVVKRRELVLFNCLVIE